MLCVDCLTAILKTVEDIHPFGLLLGIESRTLEAIQSYYNNRKYFIMTHIIYMSLRIHRKDIVMQLSNAVNAVGRYDISEQLVLLTSLGKNCVFCR